MTYDATWDLSTIPPDILKSEWGRRTNLLRVTRGGGRKPTCFCGECRKCRARGKRSVAKTPQLAIDDNRAMELHARLSGLLLPGGLL